MREREKKAAQQRKKVLESRAFEIWWNQRRLVYPTPRDAYQAYMTDLGKEARLHGERKWKREPNRFDVEPVDYPIAPAAPRPRIPPRLREALPAPPARKPSPIGLALQQLVKGWAEKKKVPVPQIQTRQIGALESGYRSFTTGEQFVLGHIDIGIAGARVEKGKPMIPEDVLGAFAHEFGHHAHAAAEVFQTGQIAKDYPRRIFTKEATLFKERKAWQIAEEMRKTSAQKWLKKYAFGTYLGQYPKKSILE